jgi:AcrR family transcriptional regulator
MATPAPRWSRLEYDERRAQILACARRLFSERHYDAVSTEEIAREAGVARGLLHHYFGTKRELYLEVVRSMLRLPDDLFAELPDDRDAALDAAVGRWLDMVERNRGTWLATVGAHGFGGDPELDAILDEARDETADRVIALVREGDPAEASQELRAVIRAYAGFAEAASLEWIERGRLTRAQAQELLVHTLRQLVYEVLPRIAWA